VKVEVMRKLLVVKVGDSSMDSFKVKGFLGTNVECQELVKPKKVVSLNSLAEASIFPVKDSNEKVKLLKGEVVKLDDVFPDISCISFIEEVEVKSQNGSLVLGACEKKDIICEYDEVKKSVKLIEACDDLPSGAMILLKIKHSKLRDDILPDLYYKEFAKRVLIPEQRILGEFKSLSAIAIPQNNVACGRYTGTVSATFRVSEPYDRKIHMESYEESYDYVPYANTGINFALCENLEDCICVHLPRKFDAGDTLVVPNMVMLYEGYYSRGLHVFANGEAHSERTTWSLQPRETTTGTLTPKDNYILANKPTTFTATLNVPCTQIDASRYYIKPPTGSTGSCPEGVTCSMSGSNIRLTRYSQYYGERSFQFILETPAPAQILGQTVSITVKDSLEYPLFTSALSFTPGIWLPPTPLPSVTIEVGLAEAKVTTGYSISFTVDYKTPATSKIEIEFPSAASFNSNLVCKVNGEQKDCKKNGNSVVISPSLSFNKGDYIKVTVENIINPYKFGLHSGFFARIRNEDGNVLASSDDLSITYDLMNSHAMVTSVATISEVFKDFNLSFAIRPIITIGEYEAGATLAVTIPSSIECKPITEFSDNLEKLDDLTFRPKGDASVPLRITMYCKEFTLKLEKFTFVITNEATSDRVTENHNMYIKKGIVSSPENFELSCSDFNPLAKAKCKLTFSRPSKEPIEGILLHGKLLDSAKAFSHLPPGVCDLQIDGFESTCTYKGEIILLILPIPLHNRVFTISGLEYINPNASEKENFKFSLRTFNANQFVLEGIIDIADGLIVATVRCDYPCSTCLNSFTSCTSCVKGGTIFYLLAPEYKCITNCPSGTYPDSTTGICKECSSTCVECDNDNTCRVCKTGYYKWKNACVKDCPAVAVLIGDICVPCSVECRTCAGTTDNCLSCDKDKYFYENKCYEECIETTGPVKTTTEKHCAKCSDNCLQCTYGTEQENPSICTKCKVGYKIADQFNDNPNTCIPLEIYDQEGENNINSTTNTTEEEKDENETDEEEISMNETENDVIPLPILTIASGGIVLGALATSGGIAFFAGSSAASAAAGAAAGGSAGAGAIAGGASTSSATGEVLGGTVDPSSAASQNPYSQVENGTNDALNDSSFIVILSYMTVLCYVTLFYNSLKKGQVLLIIVIAAAIILQMVMNLAFIFWSMENVNDEAKSFLYNSIRFKLRVLIMMFSSVFSYQTMRLFFGSFIGIKFFPMSDEVSTELRQPLNIYSLVQVGLIHAPVFLVSVCELFILRWGEVVYRSSMDAAGITFILGTLLVKESMKDQLDVIKIKLKIVERLRNLALFKSRERTNKKEKKRPTGKGKDRAEVLKKVKVTFKIKV
jgi:hypothetical protein